MTCSKSAPNAPEFCKQDNSSATFPADMEGNVEGKEKEHLNQAWATRFRDPSAGKKPSQKLNASGVFYGSLANHCCKCAKQDS